MLKAARFAGLVAVFAILLVGVLWLRCCGWCGSGCLLVLYCGGCGSRFVSCCFSCLGFDLQFLLFALICLLLVFASGCGCCVCYGLLVIVVCCLYMLGVLILYGWFGG